MSKEARLAAQVREFFDALPESVAGRKSGYTYSQQRFEIGNSTEGVGESFGRYTIKDFATLPINRGDSVRSVMS